ncbi:cell surface A33 antigen [Phascolarctos cinereus]|uniref:Cell surface A33 antigen n=1 Tax=Phascolarctos cinereus TaxID=38626 RepID=A0A6P5JH11_PHACI|nr:cell surface A33 antigen [Phascolarctos cinereus]
MRPLFFILSTLWGTAYTISVQTPTKVLRVARGENATLPCLYETTVTGRNGFIQWDKPLMDPPIQVLVWSFSSQQYTFGNQYTDRVRLSGNYMYNDASITISQLTMDDNGTYECLLMLDGDLTENRQARMDLVVLVPPSIPECSIEGETIYGNNILLNCQSKEGSPAPQYSWKSFDIENKERLLSPPATGNDLLLKNITYDTSGYYICTSTNEMGTESCNITVAVRLPSMNIALYAGIAGGVVAAFIIIGIIAYCCCCRNEKEKDSERPDREDYREPSEQMREIHRRDDNEEDRNHDKMSTGQDSPVPSSR